MTQALQDPTPPLWTVEQVAAYLNFVPETVRNMARGGQIPSIKVGKRAWRFDPEQIQAWLEKNKVSEHG